MTRIVSAVVAYDKKRWKVTLDEGVVTFLLYRGEMKQAGLRAPKENAGGEAGSEAQAISEETWQKIRDVILLPRAKKRVLFYLKNGDKTEFQMRRKLQEGFYPQEVIDEVIAFLRKYRLADDARYTENYVRELRGKHSRREIEAKLYAKGLKGETVKEVLSEIPQEDEYGAAEKALSKRRSGDRKKDYAYLARKGFSYDAIEHAMNRMEYKQEDDSAFDY